jgi:hypothetical protein
MAALLLSFGLMMTGCDSGGDSDSDSGPTINAADYIDIAVDTAGAENTAAVYKVTVKQAVPAANKAVFANVADAAVEYIPALGGETTKEAQATAIATALTGAAGAKYTAGIVDTSGEAPFFLLTANTPGVITAAPDKDVANYEAPQDKTAAIAAALTAGDNAVKITGVTVANAFKDDDTVKAYIKNDGTELFITTESSTPSVYAPAANAVFIADRGANNVPVLWVKGLPAAATPVTAGTSLLSGGSAGAVSVKITGAAQNGDVGDLTPVSGTAVVLPAGVKTLIAFGAASANEVSLKGGNGSQIHYHNGTGDVTATLSATFDTQLSAVLAATGLLAADDEITVGAKGIITGAELIAGPSAAIISTALGVVDNVTIGLNTTLAATDVVDIPAGKTLTLKTGIDLSFTSGSGTTGAKITGNGKLVAGFTEIIPGATGVIGSSGNAEKTTTIAHTGGVTTITGVDANAILVVSSGAVITQKAGSGSELTLAATTVVNILDGATLTLGEAVILNLPNATTAIINVGSTDATKFAIAGVAGGASTLTVGASGTGTVSLEGLQAGSKIKGSAATATLTGGGTADATIAIAGAATGGVIIDTVTINVSTKGNITIAQGGILILAGANAKVKCSSNSTPLTGNNRLIANATIGGNIAVTANTDGESGKVIGTITGAASNNTITPSGGTAVELKVNLVNA